MDKNLLDKWLNGTHTADDLQQLEKDPAFAAYRKIDRFAKQIELPEFSTETSLQEVKALRNKTVQKEPKVRVLPTLLKVAAILTILAASYVFYNSIAPTTIETRLAENTTHVLPDTSEVQLNENSEISYNKNKWEASRELTLVGEAYFKVAKGESFTVNTKQGAVTVLGTEFNVFSRENTFEVVCYEGLVAVTHNSENIQLEPGFGITITDDTIENSLVYVNKPEWLDEESSYNDTAITNVLKDLERTYNITVTTQNIDVTLRFTGSYTHKDLEAALQTITLPLGLTYAIKSDTSVIISPEQTME